MEIKRIEPLITAEQTLELVRLGCNARTVEMEKAVALAIKAIHAPPFFVEDDGVSHDD